MTFDEAFMEAGAVERKLKSDPAQFNFDGSERFGEVKLICYLNKFPYTNQYTYKSLLKDEKLRKHIQDTTKNDEEPVEWHVSYTVTEERTVEVPTLTLSSK